MFRVAPFVLAVVLSALAGASAVRANEAADFMQRFSGSWLGTGQLLFGSENGLQFHCELNGNPSRTQLTFAMKGRCWMGGISAPVHARLRYNAETKRFYGEFMDGADGNGVDMIGERDGEGFSLRLSRGVAQGRLAAETVNSDQMRVMMFYRDRANNRELPVVAMGFTRKEASAMGLPHFLPEVLTGSLSPAN